MLYSEVMSKTLNAVKRATTRRATAEESYRAAINEARAAGHTLPQIGEAAGISAQGVHYLLFPDPRKTKT